EVGPYLVFSPIDFHTGGQFINHFLYLLHFAVYLAILSFDICFSPSIAFPISSEIAIRRFAQRGNPFARAHKLTLSKSFSQTGAQNKPSIFLRISASVSLAILKISFVPEAFSISVLWCSCSLSNSSKI